MPLDTMSQSVTKALPLTLGAGHVLFSKLEEVAEVTDVLGCVSVVKKHLVTHCVETRGLVAAQLPL